MADMRPGATCGIMLRVGMGEEIGDKFDEAIDQVEEDIEELLNTDILYTGSDIGIFSARDMGYNTAVFEVLIDEDMVRISDMDKLESRLGVTLSSYGRELEVIIVNSVVIPATEVQRNLRPEARQVLSRPFLNCRVGMGFRLRENKPIDKPLIVGAIRDGTEYEIIGYSTVPSGGITTTVMESPYTAVEYSIIRDAFNETVTVLNETVSPETVIGFVVSK